MLRVYGAELRSRLFLGTAQYPSPAVLAKAVEAAAVEVVTVSLRRESGAGLAGQGFWSLIRGLGVRVLPNTAGCHSAREAVTTAQMAREVFGTPWIKLRRKTSTIASTLLTISPKTTGIAMLRWSMR